MCEDEKIREFLREVLTEGTEALQFPTVSIIANLVDKDIHGFMERQGLLEASGITTALQRLTVPNNKLLTDLIKEALEGFTNDVS